MKVKQLQLENVLFLSWVVTGNCLDVLVLGYYDFSLVNYPETQINSVTRLFLEEMTGDKNT
jgi:hypothetical protein